MHFGKSHIATLTCIGLAALAIAGCAKNASHGSSPGALAASGTTPNMISAALQLPMPGNTYGTSSAYPPSANAPNPGSHVTRLSTIVDAVAAPLKESNIALLQTLSQGQYLNGSLHVAHSALNTDLSGSRQDNQGHINWTYKMDGNVVFSGNTSISGTAGNLTFPVSSQNIQPIAVNWSFSASAGQSMKSITVSQGTVGNVGFTLTYPKNSYAPSVALSGKGGSGIFTGNWNSNGGYLQEGSEAKQCWNAKLQDITCPQ